MISFAGRMYRLSPPDETGTMFGRSAPQVAIAFSGIAAGSILFIMANFWIGLLVGGVLISFGLAEVKQQPLYGWVGHFRRFIKFRAKPSKVWLSPIPLLGGDGSSAPGVIGEHELLVVDAAAFGVGGKKIAVSRDKADGTVSATIRVSGRNFNLEESGHQDFLIEQWGTALQSFVSTQTGVSSVRWTESVAPAGLEPHVSWINDHSGPRISAKQADSYNDLLNSAGQAASLHEVLVTVTVNPTKVVVKRDDSVERAVVQRLLDELGLLSQRLVGASLQVSQPLSPAAWSRVLRLRLDPSCRLGLDAVSQSLGDVAGGVDPSTAAPLATEETWTYWKTDGSFHRSLYVEDWPRRDIPASWMSPLLSWSGSVRTVAVFFEPVPRPESLNRITKAAGKIDADADDRRKSGWHVGARHKAAKNAVLEKEEEIVSGYGEMRYGGVVVVTGQSLDELDAATANITQVAGGIGVKLHTLHGRHELAIVSTLPLARTVKPTLSSK